MYAIRPPPSPILDNLFNVVFVSGIASSSSVVVSQGNCTFCWDFSNFLFNFQENAVRNGRVFRVAAALGAVLFLKKNYQSVHICIYIRVSTRQ